MKCDDCDSLGRLIYFTAQEIRNFAERILKPYDLTLEQFHVLKNLSANSGASQRELGTVVNKTPANMTRMLDRLEAKSLILRRDNPDDRRVSLIFLAPGGQSLVDEVFQVLKSFSTAIHQGITEQENRVIRTGLSKISANIRNMSETLSTANR